MPSVVDVCNRALDKVGHGSITSLDDGNKAANLCKRNWPLVRDITLRAHPWNFAVKRATTAPSSTSPDWGFTYAHPVPSDFLRLIEVRDLSQGEYQLENNKILADDDTLYIRYIAQITDPNEYDDLFMEAAASRLGADLAEPLTQSNTKKADLEQEFRAAIMAAKRVDGVENPPAQFEEDDWVNARY